MSKLKVSVLALAATLCGAVPVLADGIAVNGVATNGIAIDDSAMKSVATDGLVQVVSDAANIAVLLPEDR